MLSLVLDHDLKTRMGRGIINSIFWGLLMVWGYFYPYQWWLKYGQDSEVTPRFRQTDATSTKASPLPPPFWGSSLKSGETLKTSESKGAPVATGSTVNLAGPMLDEMKACFGEGPLASLNSINGDLNQLVSTLEGRLGPVQLDNLVEKKVTIAMKNGSSRTLVYEWIGEDEGSDLYWYETDAEGFPKPIDLPAGTGSDLESFEKIKQTGTPGKLSEVHMIDLSNDMQLGVEKIDGAVQSVSLKDDDHMAKCRKDAIKTFVCDCFN